MDTASRALPAEPVNQAAHCKLLFSSDFDNRQCHLLEYRPQGCGIVWRKVGLQVVVGLVGPQQGVRVAGQVLTQRVYAPLRPLRAGWRAFGPSVGSVATSSGYADMELMPPGGFLGECHVCMFLALETYSRAASAYLHGDKLYAVLVCICRSIGRWLNAPVVEPCYSTGAIQDLKVCNAAEVIPCAALSILPV